MIYDIEKHILELRALGWGINRIAKTTGATDHKVEAVLRAHGLHKERRDMTATEANRISEMRKAGSSIANIARATGWSESKIQRTLTEVGLNGWTANREIKTETQRPTREQVIALYGSGESAGYIAKKLGMRKTRITDIAKEAGIYREPDRLSDEQRREVLRLRAEGLSGPAIAEKIGRSPAAVREYLVKHNLNARIRRPVRVEGEIAYVSLTQGGEAIIDAADAERVGQYNWSLIKANGNNHYATGTVAGKNVALHRFVVEADPDLFVDHINHDGLDCRRANLRQVSASLNAFNARRSRDTGLPKGVYSCKDGYYAVFRSRVCETPEEAAALRKVHYEGLLGEGRDGFLDADKFIDPDTGEVLDG